jgi:hypothetical protein
MELTFGNILGGVNYTYPPNELPMTYLADAQNILPVLNGYGAPRKGSSIKNSVSLPHPVRSIHEFNRNLYALHGTTIGKYSDAYNTFPDHISGLDGDAYGQWWNYGDYAIYVDGVSNPRRTDGTTSADLTADMAGLTGGSCICEWGERIWIPVGAELNGSALRAPTDFSTATADIGYYQGDVGSTQQPITGVFPFFDMLLIGKINQVYQLTGAPETASSTFRLTPLQTKDSDSFGFTSKNALALVGNDLVFLDGFNIKALSGVVAYGDVESISIIGNIRDFFLDPDGAGLDKDLLKYTHFFHYKHREQIHVSIPTGTLTRYWFVIDYSNQAIRSALELPRFSFFPLSANFVPLCFGGVEDGSRVNVYCGCDDGYVRQLDTGVDDSGTAIDSYMTWCFGHDSRNLQPLYVNLNVKYDGALTLTPSYAMGLTDWEEIRKSANFTSLGSETVDSSWRVTASTAYKRLSSMMYNTDKSFAFKLSHNNADETYEMRRSALGYRLKHRYAG